MTMSLRPFRLSAFRCAFAIGVACTAAIAGVAQAEDNKTPAAQPAVAQASPAPVCAAPDDSDAADESAGAYRQAPRGRRAGDDRCRRLVINGGCFRKLAGQILSSRLAAELKERFPGQPITVINRGANGEGLRQSRTARQGRDCREAGSDPVAGRHQRRCCAISRWARPMRGCSKG